MSRFVRVALVVAVAAAIAGCELAVPGADLAAGPQPAPAPIVGEPRVLLVGDSIMDQAGDKAAQLLAARGIDVTLQGEWGSGPMPVPGEIDWLAEARRLATSVRPDLTVVMFYGNYWPPFVRRADGTAMAIGDADFCATWGARVRRMVDAFQAVGSRVIIASSAPNDRGEDARQKPGLVYECERRALAGRRGVSFVDTGMRLSPDDAYQRVEEMDACDGGPPIRLRPARDVHVTAPGALRLGGGIADAVLAAFGRPGLGAAGSGQAVVGIVRGPRDGYRTLDCAGGIHDFGDARPLAGAVRVPGGTRAAGFAPSPSGNGYWLVTDTGSVSAFGDARYHGSARLHDVVAIAARPSGDGYWLATRDGAVHGFGAARALQAVRVSSPVVGIAPSTTGNGYWLATADGGVFAFGDARFLGSAAGHGPVVGIAPTRTGRGYWLAGRDGGVFAFGDARFLGTPPRSGAPIVGIATAAHGTGYWLVGRNLAVYAFGSARFRGTMAGTTFLSSHRGRHVPAH